MFSALGFKDEFSTCRESKLVALLENHSFHVYIDLHLFHLKQKLIDRVQSV